MKRTREICKGCSELIEDEADANGGICWFYPGEVSPNEVPRWCIRLMEYVVLTQDGENGQEILHTVQAD